MSQSERERALRAAAEIAKTQRSGWRLNTSGNMASDLIEKNILALIDQPAALDTPQEPTPALRDRFKEFDEAVKFVRANGYSDWNGTANGQEITLTGCANLVRKALYETGATATPEPTPAAPAVANARLELTDAVNTTPAAPPSPSIEEMEFENLPTECGGTFKCPLTEAEWIQERLDNCRRIAAQKKPGRDRNGWLEDAGYFERVLATLAAAPRPALSPDALRQLIAEWRAEARKNIPDDYTKRHLEHKYLKLDNYASGLDDCADVLEDLLRAPAPREGA